MLLPGIVRRQFRLSPNCMFRCKGNPCCCPAEHVAGTDRPSACSSAAGSLDHAGTMNTNLDSISDSSDGFRIQSRWFIPAPRGSVYAVASDFERLPQHFPRIARSTKVISRDGNRLVIDAEAASFGRFFPDVRIRINAELLPGEGYRCSTFNQTFQTSGEEELLLSDAPGGTQIIYSYTVNLRHRWLRLVYIWLVRRFALRFWKRAYLEPLVAHCRSHDDVA